MFKPGNILYFDPFIFSNGDVPKAKYFLVLKETTGNLILASLPTSKDSVPTSIPLRHGCLEEESINLNCNTFLAGYQVAQHPETSDLFAFPKNTFVYGFRIAKFKISVLEQQINESVVKAELKGCLFENEYSAIVNCLKASSSVKRKYRKLL